MSLTKMITSWPFGSVFIIKTICKGQSKGDCDYLDHIKVIYFIFGVYCFFFLLVFSSLFGNVTCIKETETISVKIVNGISEKIRLNCLEVLLWPHTNLRYIVAEKMKK